MKSFLCVKYKNYTAHAAYKAKYKIQCKKYGTLAMTAIRISGG